MIRIVITPAARDDLDNLWDQDEDSAAEIETALDEISNDQRLLQRLTQKKFRTIQAPTFDVDAFEELWKRGINLYRLKFWDWEGSLVPYRVLYAYHAAKDTYFVLAVVPRNIAYDTKHPIVTRVRTDYDALGIPTY
jgi:mRNA-degrading endonuclease RelE of RelBE toxin-antitoxin system